MNRIIKRIFRGAFRITRNIFLKIKYRDRLTFKDLKLWQYTIKKGFMLEPILEEERGKRLIVFLGNHVRIQDDVLIKGSAHVILGKRTLVGRRCIIGSNVGVTIKKDTLLAENVSIRDSDHVYQKRSRKIREQGIESAPIIIEEDVWEQ